MITIETDRVFSLYIRTNRRVKWQYAQYGGRYETVEKAIETAKKHMGETPFEYLVENFEGETLTTGLVNWFN